MFLPAVQGGSVSYLSFLSHVTLSKRKTLSVCVLNIFILVMVMHDFTDIFHTFVLLSLKLVISQYRGGGLLVWTPPVLAGGSNAQFLVKNKKYFGIFGYNF